MLIGVFIFLQIFCYSAMTRLKDLRRPILHKDKKDIKRKPSHHLI